MTAQDVKKAMGKRFLDAQGPKKQNMVSKPELLTEGLYRRRPPMSALATRARPQRQYQRGAKLGCPVVEHGLEGGPPLRDRRQMECQGYLCPLSDTVRVLGALLDNHMTLGDHFRTLMAKAQGRQGILAKVARVTWGLNSAALRVTHDALITTLLRYGLVLTGSCWPDDLMRRLIRGRSTLHQERSQGCHTSPVVRRSTSLRARDQ